MQSCARDGVKYKECTRCGIRLKVATIPAAHSEGSGGVVDIDATCTTGGYVEETCTECGDIIHTNETEALGHDDYDIARRLLTEIEYSCGETATDMIYTCTTCGAVLTGDEMQAILTRIGSIDSVYYFTRLDENYNDVQDYVVGHFDEELAAEMLELVNAHRANYESDALTTTYINSNGTDVSERIAAYAEERAVEISCLFDHMAPAYGMPSSSGENIAWVGNEFATAEEVFNAWKDSPGHNTNMLYPGYGYIAIKAFLLEYDSGTENNYAQYWVQSFYYSND